jgi:NIPSNAP
VIAEACGAGDVPHEGTSNIALAPISFESLAAYEAYRAWLRGDEAGMANFRFAEEGRFILSEERTLLRGAGAGLTDCERADRSSHPTDLT